MDGVSISVARTVELLRAAGHDIRHHPGPSRRPKPVTPEWSGRIWF